MIADDGTECAQADIVFVVDSSGSIGADNWPLVLNFTASMVESFPVGDLGARFGFILYERVYVCRDSYFTCVNSHFVSA